MLEADAKKMHDFLFSRGSELESKNPTRSAQHSDLQWLAFVLIFIGFSITKWKMTYGHRYAVLLFLLFLNIFYIREALAYLTSRGPFTYGATYRVLREISGRFPKWTPTSILDFGAGVGMTGWAVNTLWNSDPSKRVLSTIETSAEMKKLSQGLLETGGETGARIMSELFETKLELSLSNDDKISREATGSATRALVGGHDLVVSAFTLGEINDKNMRLDIVRSLWKQTQGILVLVDVGNRWGHLVIQEAREYFRYMEEGYHFLGPCPGEGSCPRLFGDPLPCHFPVRVGLPKGLNLSPSERRTGLHSGKFSYLIVAREAKDRWNKFTTNPNNSQARIVSGISKRKGHVYMDVCSCRPGKVTEPESDDNLVFRHIVAKSAGKEAWKYAKKAKWGDKIDL